MADTGAISPGTMVDDSTVGTLTWTNPNDAKTENVTSAYAATAGASTVSSVKIVKGDSISGDEKSDSYAITSTLTYRSYGSSSNLWGLSWTVANINASDFGVVISAVGTSGTSHYLKATNFGFAIPTNAVIDGIVAEIKISRNNFNTFVDHIRITVYYTAGATTPRTLISQARTLATGRTLSTGRTLASGRTLAGT